VTGRRRALISSGSGGNMAIWGVAINAKVASFAAFGITSPEQSHESFRKREVFASSVREMRMRSTFLTCGEKFTR
jgi:hypothetical protein